ncbi:hypothetical protein Hypma_007038 [Hypsizygus marmoreus]|uniref:F-box domain-containing protein n=1 Tax=Hypsizygus marmoreus TaxID=39966 RepID=A0A369KBW5_HYPMA|nr:hypothetical protein Hypma_007038 [Hypsizygus marmoreus]
MPATSDIPQDIIYVILDNLHDNHQALSACASTARSFRTYAQKLLFATIKIELPPYSTRTDHIRDLHNILMRNPLLIDHIRHVVLLLHYFHVGNSQSFPAFHHDDDGGRSKLLPTIRLLRRLRKLTIDPFVGLAVATWNEFSEDLRSEILAVIWLPNVIDFSLSGINSFPASFLLQCPHLKRISWRVQRMRVREEVPLLSVDEPSADGMLKYYDTSDIDTLSEIVAAISRNPSGHLTFKHLEGLNIELWSPNHYTDCQDVLTMCAMSLSFLSVSIIEENLGELTFPLLSLTIYNTFILIDVMLNITNMQALRSFQIDLSYLNRSADIRAWLEIFLSSKLPNTGVLQRFTVRLPDYTPLWIHIDDVLVDATRLAKVHIDIRLNHMPPQFLVGAFPRLAERGDSSIYIDEDLFFMS